ncbi:MAG: class I SAM-dependent methyltransferase, partial [Terrimicrobiaceae bacterium]
MRPAVAPLLSCPVCASACLPAYEHPEAQIYRCQSCSHCFSNPATLVPENYEPAYYEQVHKNWFAHPNFSLFERIRKLIASRGTTCRVLDVGCGRGDLLKYLQARNPQLELTGIELSDLQSAAGIRFIKSDIFEFEVTKRFDFVIALAVIEHVADIQQFVLRLSSLARPGGTVLVMTLNEGSLLYRVARSLRCLGWKAAFERLYSSHHLHHFTVRSLFSLMQKSGLRVQKQFTHNFPLAAVDFSGSDSLVGRIQ